MKYFGLTARAPRIHIAMEQIAQGIGLTLETTKINWIGLTKTAKSCTGGKETKSARHNLLDNPLGQNPPPKCYRQNDPCHRNKRC